MLFRSQFSAALARRAHKNTRERSPMLKGLLRIRRYQQETPCALQEAENRSWLRCGEAHSALRDRRPIPAALQFHSVVHCSGTEEILPTTTAYSGRPRREKRTPTNQRSIRKKTCSVKFSRNGAVENSKKLGVWTRSCEVQPERRCPMYGWLSSFRRPLRDERDLR